MDKLQAVEERVAHLQRTVEDLSDVVTRQDAEIRRLSRLVGLLSERDAAFGDYREREKERNRDAG